MRNLSRFLAGSQFLGWYTNECPVLDNLVLRFQINAGNNYNWSLRTRATEHMQHIYLLLLLTSVFILVPCLSFYMVLNACCKVRSLRKMYDWQRINILNRIITYCLKSLACYPAGKKKHFNKCQPHLQKISTITNHTHLFQDYHLISSPNCCWDNSNSFDVTGKVQVKIFLCLAFTINAKILQNLTTKW